MLKAKKMDLFHSHENIRIITGKSGRPFRRLGIHNMGEDALFEAGEVKK